MHRGILLSIVILIGTSTLGCRENESPPPPAPPALARREIPEPPGRDDYARRGFRTPLSVQDAEAILRETRQFEFGGMPPKRQVQAFNVVFEQPDAITRFQRLRRTLAEEPQVILVFDSDVIDKKAISELAGLVERRALGTCSAECATKRTPITRSPKMPNRARPPISRATRAR